jgi:hypothetical protein
MFDRRREAVLELLLRCDADVAQDGAGEFGKEALDKIEPVIGSESEFEATRRLTGEPDYALFEDLRGIVAYSQLGCRPRRIGGIERLSNSMNSQLRWRSLTARGPSRRRDRSVQANKMTGPWRLYSCSRAKVAWTLGSRGKSRVVLAIAWIVGFSS